MQKLSKDRNGTSIFASRAEKNLEFIRRAAARGEDVHPVTQAIVSTLGIIVFPWETSAFDVVKKKKLSVLQEDGWPQWEMEGRKVIELQHLIRALRNAVAHGRIEFDSDDRDPAAVKITFEDPGKGPKGVPWKGTIRGDQLITFCRYFVSTMHDYVD